MGGSSNYFFGHLQPANLPRYGGLIGFAASQKRCPKEGGKMDRGPLIFFSQTLEAAKI